MNRPLTHRLVSLASPEMTVGSPNRHTASRALVRLPRRVRLVLILAALAALLAVPAGTALGSGRCQRTCIDGSPTVAVHLT